ncbi:MAG TPA: sugar transferase, partial [Planctomycetaceae bacterium]|nr:sugar transferase [Planctomycetaceae bacterium]
DVAGLSGIHIRDHLLFPFQRFSKRIIDIVLSACLILLFSPLMLIIGALVWLKSPGPVLYRHNGRIGREGHTFGALKIRTMVQNADEALKKYLAENPEAKAEWDRDLKLKNDPRIISGIGGFLRRTSLDELPQLWNVLIGEMSLVGPRPIYTEIEVSKFQEMYPLYLRVRPGLTGLWQVSGRNNTSYEDRVKLDTYYVRNWSLWLDYFILLRTVRTVLFREGSY